MKFKSITIGLFLVFLASQLFAQDTRLLKGKVTSSKEALIGAMVFEDDNRMNGVITNAIGEFEIQIPQQEKVILYIYYGSYHGGFYVEINEKDEYVVIDVETKKARRKSKRVYRKNRLDKKKQSKKSKTPTWKNQL